MATALFAAIAILAMPQGASQDKPAEQKWLTNFAEAQKVAQKEKKPMLVNFTGSDWCGWCHKLRDEVFVKDEFKAWAKKSVILVELDFPSKAVPQSEELKKQNSGLADKYKIKGFPTILFLDAEEKQLAESGYKKGGPTVWTADADKMLAEAAKAKGSQ